jgi:carbon-monoxide dehydrogenase iron sulfur subunit
MQKQIVIDIDRCTGCGSCELICSFTHHGEFNPLKSRIHKTYFLEQCLAIPVVCYQCEDPWCAKVCPAGAITTDKDPEGGATVITVHEDKCVGCKMCMLACPFGNIVVSDKGYAEKCNLCGGDPECVKVCRSGAIKFEMPYAGIIARKKGVAKTLLDSYKEV